MTHDPEEGVSLVQRLALFTERLIQIVVDEKRLWSELADFGYLGETCLRVHVGDLAAVVRLKEALIRRHRERSGIIAEMADIGAFVHDWETMEILIGGGPEPNSWQSWMPGEPSIAWWRASKSDDSERHLLPGLNSRDIRPNHH